MLIENKGNWFDYFGLSWCYDCFFPEEEKIGVREASPDFQVPHNSLRESTPLLRKKHGELSEKIFIEKIEEEDREEDKKEAELPDLEQGQLSSFSTGKNFPEASPKNTPENVESNSSCSTPSYFSESEVESEKDEKDSLSDYEYI